MMAGLAESLSLFASRVSECAESDRAVAVTTHMDCDGIAAGGIVTKAAIRAGARCSARAVKEFGAAEAKALPPETLHIVVDVGGATAAELDAAVGDSWIIIDHHQVRDEEMAPERVINPWKHGIDGGTEICSGGMAYLAAVELDSRNADLSPVAVVAALGDRQDQGEGRSLVGRNAEIAAKAAELKLLDVGDDLLLAGRETRALADALAFTTRPFIEGLTWNRDACASLLEGAGIAARDGGRWRVAAELTDDEKRSLVEAIASHAGGAGTEAVRAELVGSAYTLLGEGSKGLLRDAREFATVLNSCGRVGRAGTGMALCMGDRTRMVSEAEEALSDYRRAIRDCMERLSSERWRTSEAGPCVMVNAEGVVAESMTGTISSMIAGAPSSAGKIVMVRSAAEGGRVKFSSRKARGCGRDVNLSEVMREAAERFGGIGGGHEAAAGARVAKGSLGGFLDHIERNVSGVQGADSHS
ncbi:MAG: DHH family phosphoesterase [Thaumarchaeota archaeon]|nr:DHH family phosphoesterase [Nitrososphaerota archaeon]RNJ73659.1 MAG: DHH family phosphoesterase [Thaumarchaeota archaeon S13]RNJ73882.1 MAG: DHH family phosphoesterase [Thaumarchaeota archaeon S14]MDD9808616.1 DHH family phosphoesterase [Nitrososphaerota archaeon]MDD9813721.1 DHH family phosphoesterase [Nitrososphaerota archaeon]